MPLLDVTEVLFDPDFMDSLVCTRSAQTIGDNGRAMDTQTDMPFTGVVTSDTGDILDRLAEGSRAHGSIMVHTTFRLRELSQGYDADIVTWNGSTYTVSNVNDYSRYGRGFVAASCDLIPLQGDGDAQ